MSHHIYKSKYLWILAGVLLVSHPAFVYSVETPATEKAAVEEDNKNPNPESNTEFEKLLDKELEGNQKAEVKNDYPTNWVYQIFKTIIGLGFIIGTIYLLRKYMVFKNNFTGAESRIIKILHEFPVAAGKKLQIIEIGNKLFLLGISDAGIQLISEFKEKISIDQIKLDMDTHGKTENPDFWVEMSKSISNKIRDLFHRKPDNKIFEQDDSNWQNIQSNHRLKINELKEKKKFFEDVDVPVEKKHEI